MSDTLLSGNTAGSGMDSYEQDQVTTTSAQNGFINPQMIHQVDEMDHESTEMPSQDDSETSSEKIRPISPRKSYLPTGCCYDDRMKLHANADFSASPHHPEDPRRIAAIFDHLKLAGLIFSGTEDELRVIMKLSPTQFMYRIAARRATPGEIMLVHEPSHFVWVQSLTTMSSQELRNLTMSFDEGRKSLYVGNLTETAAAISAGGAIDTCKAVLEGKVKNAIAVIRPPGHHAEANESLGFCIYNNVAVAAAVCMQDYPEKCRKVLILDWDVHHGNGIQNMFYNNPNVLYISLHVYRNGDFYPGPPDDPNLADGGLANCGDGLGIGRNVNIGWADQGMGDGEYMAAFQRIVMPIAQEFDPDLVIVSAGFDAAAGDELGGCFVTPACYSQMTHMLMSLADGKLAVCLEGGYNLQAISRSALAVAKTLMGEPPLRLMIPPLNRDAAFTLDNVKRIQARYWQCMRPGVIPNFYKQDKELESFSKVIRNHQKAVLSEKFDMVPLYIHRNAVSLYFEDQVLSTQELFRAKRIMVIIHDPPEVLAHSDPYNNSVHADNAFVSNNIFPYIEWAVSNGMGVLDISIPRDIPEGVVTDSSPPTSNQEFAERATKEVLSYLWDNYLELCPYTPILLMGVGDAYHGIKQLLVTRPCRQRIAGALAFVSGNLTPVRSEIDDNLSSWFKSSSLIYVSPEHACWHNEAAARKVKKRKFGNVVKALIDVTEGEGSESSVWRMLKHHEADAWQYAEQSFERWEAMNGKAKDSDDTDSEGEGEQAGGDDGDVEMGFAETMTVGVSERVPARNLGRGLEALYG